MEEEMPKLLDPNQAKEKKSYDKRNVKFTQIDVDVANALAQLKEDKRISTIKGFVSSILRTVLVKEYKVEVGE